MLFLEVGIVVVGVFILFRLDVLGVFVCFEIGLVEVLFVSVVGVWFWFLLKNGVLFRWVSVMVEEVFCGLIVCVCFIVMFDFVGFFLGVVIFCGIVLVVEVFIGCWLVCVVGNFFVFFVR